MFLRKVLTKLFCFNVTGMFCQIVAFLNNMKPEKGPQDSTYSFSIYVLQLSEDFSLVFWSTHIRKDML